MDFRSESVIYAGLWIAWAWIIYRYSIYFRATREDVRQNLIAEQSVAIKSAFTEILLGIAEKNAKEYARNAEPNAKSIVVEAVSRVDNPERHGWKSVTAMYDCLTKVTFEEKPGYTELAEARLKASVTGFALDRRLLAVVLPVNIGHRYFSEYYLALLFAATPVMVGTIKIILYLADNYPAWMSVTPSGQ